MKKFILYILVGCSAATGCAQSAKTDLYDLIKKLMYDSTGYENVGDWAIGQPNKFPIKWKADRIEISEDTSINFYRLGTADISVNAGRPAY